MAEFEARIEVAADPASAFEYLSDFVNVAEWDPSVRDALIGLSGWTKSRNEDMVVPQASQKIDNITLARGDFDSSRTVSRKK